MCGCLRHHFAGAGHSGGRHYLHDPVESVTGYDGMTRIIPEYEFIGYGLSSRNILALTA